MARFVALAKLSDDPLAGAPDVMERFNQVQQLLESIGGSQAEGFWTLGAYDIVVIADDLDAEGAAAFELALRAALPATVVTLPVLGLNGVAETMAKVAPEVEKARPATGRPATGRPATGRRPKKRPATGRPATGRAAPKRGGSGRQT